MLEAVLPFSHGEVDAEVERLVVLVQRHARGHACRLARRRLSRDASSLRACVDAWKLVVHRQRQLDALRRHAVEEHHAVVVQRAFRRHCARWTRPEVGRLLRRVRTLEAQLSKARKKRASSKGKKARSSDVAEGSKEGRLPPVADAATTTDAACQTKL
jgi:hypothetical protein